VSVISIPTPERPRAHSCFKTLWDNRPPWGYAQCTCGRWFVSKDKFSFWDFITGHWGIQTQQFWWIRQYGPPRKAPEVLA